MPIWIQMEIKRIKQEKYHLSDGREHCHWRRTASKWKNKTAEIIYKNFKTKRKSKEKKKDIKSSSTNWQRPRIRVDTILRLLRKFWATAENRFAKCNHDGYGSRTNFQSIKFLVGCSTSADYGSIWMRKLFQSNTIKIYMFSENSFHLANYLFIPMSSNRISTLEWSVSTAINRQHHTILALSLPSIHF